MYLPSCSHFGSAGSATLRQKTKLMKNPARISGGERVGWGGVGSGLSLSCQNDWEILSSL